MTNFIKICFINNYNNAPFLSECLSSVISQTVTFDRVIIVDDGSSDGSETLLKGFQEQYPKVEVYRKDNGGQLSTFNYISELIPENSQVFLLDADDVYPRDYLQLVLTEFNNKPWDFAFCSHQVFEKTTDTLLKSGKISAEPTIFFGSTSALVRSRHCWIGNITSTISLSGSAFRKIFPYPNESNRALWTDDLMIFSSSILGLKKTYLSGIAIAWRCHNTNDSKKAHPPQYLLDKKQGIDQLFNYYCAKYKISRYPTISEFYSELNNLNISWRKRLSLPNHWHLLNRLIRNRYLGWAKKNR